MSFIKTDANTLVDASQIELVTDRGDDHFTITAEGGGYQVTFSGLISSFDSAWALVQISSSQFVPSAAIAKIVALPSGAAQIKTFSGRLIPTTFAFATIAAAVSALTP